MKLNFREFGEAGTGAPTVLLLHGLFGSSINWQRIANNLSSEHHVIVPDLRNHGRSPHDADVSYQAMAGDILQLLDDQQVDEAILVGHSMGGKLAMWLALSAADRVSRLVPVDMAPVTYRSNFTGILNALMALPLAELESRTAADAWLAAAIPAVSVRNFLLQNLQRTGNGWQWRNNLAAIDAGIGAILDFPTVPAGRQYTGPALFIYGGQSDYVLPEYHPRILELFPAAELQSIAGAGHWVYADQPEAFLHILNSRLDASN